jgi:hypothetical protein
VKIVLGLISIAALGAGLTWGYLDHNRSGTVRESTPRAERIAPPAAPGEKSPPPGVPEKAATKAALPAPDQEELAARTREIEAAIRKEDFAAASRIAEPMVEKYRENPQAAELLTRLRQAEKKARAYEALLASLDRRELPDPLYRVEISNGVKFLASQAQETGEGWRFEVISGGFSSWSKEKVAAVRPYPRKDYLAERWKEIQAGTRDWKEPADLFFFGIRKCFRDGLRAQGLGLIDKLLAMPDSAQVVVIYAKDGTAGRSWEQAAGRQPLEPLAPTEVASAPGGSAPAGRGGGEDEAEGSPVDLTQVEALIARAEATFREGKGDPGKTFEARTLIWGPVAKILFGLPAEDPRVEQLKARAQELMAKIMKEK